MASTSVFAFCSVLFSKPIVSHGSAAGLRTTLRLPSAPPRGLDCFCRLNHAWLRSTTMLVRHLPATMELTARRRSHGAAALPTAVYRCLRRSSTAWLEMLAPATAVASVAPPLGASRLRALSRRKCSTLTLSNAPPWRAYASRHAIAASGWSSHATGTGCLARLARLSGARRASRPTSSVEHRHVCSARADHS